MQNWLEPTHKAIISTRLEYKILSNKVSIDSTKIDDKNEASAVWDRLIGPTKYGPRQTNQTIFQSNSVDHPNTVKN